jgi:hypothetical protein
MLREAGFRRNVKHSGGRLQDVLVSLCKIPAESPDAVVNWEDVPYFSK